MKCHFLNLFFLILSIQLFTNETQGQFFIDAQLRNRFEFRDGYQNLLPEKANPAFYISQRSRLNLSFENKNLKVKFSPQDVRIWGDEQLASSTGVFGDQASLDLFEGYAEIKAASEFWISIGRQQLVYDNQRLLAARNWNQLGIAYDAVVAKCKLYDWKLHVGASWNTLFEANSENLYDPSRIKSMNFLWLNRKLNKNLELSLIHLATGITKTDTTSTLYFRQTTGVYSDFKKDAFHLQADFYYQYGKNKAGMKVGAFLAAADVGYKLGKLTPGIGFEYLSGNSQTGTAQTTDHLFDLLYGARHRFLGFMDYFRNIPSHTRQGGIADYYAYLELKITKKISIQDIGHYFSLSQTNPNTPKNKDLGFENDLVLKYKFSEWGVMEGGYLFLLPTKSLKTMQNISNEKFAQFAYLQLTLTPVLFNQKDHQKN